MPITVTRKLYYFEELPTQEAKYAAIEAWREYTWEYGNPDLECTLADCAGRELREAGYDAPLDDEGERGTLELAYSVSFSQGDGLAFYGTISAGSLLPLIRRLFKDNRSSLHTLLWLARNGEINASIEKNRNFYRYEHYNTMEVSVEFNGYSFEPSSKQLTAIAALEEAIAQDVQDQSQSIYSKMCDEALWWTEEKNIAGFLSDQGNLYDEEGAEA